MKKFIIVGVAVFLCISLIVIRDNVNTKNEYREKYFSDNQKFIEVKDIIIKHYEQNEFETELSYWSGEKSLSIFKIIKYNDDITIQKVENQEISYPLSNDEILKINQLLANSYFECIDVDTDFVEFGNTTGSITIWYSRNGEKPKPIDKHYSMVNMGDGWYCSRSTAR